MMKTLSRKLSFTAPILVSFAGILTGFLLIATMVVTSQHKDMVDHYHTMNKNFIRNVAINYAASALRENDYILDRTATYLAHNDQLDRLLSLHHQSGMTEVMKLLGLMPTVSSISIADINGHFLRAPEILRNTKTDAFDPASRPWFIHQAGSGLITHYTSIYKDAFTHNPVISIYDPIVTSDGKLIGTLSFDLDLSSMGETLRQMQAPVPGAFFVVNRQGLSMINPDTELLFRQMVTPQLMEQMTSGEGIVYDNHTKTWLYYYSFTNPDWFVIYKVKDSTLDSLARKETMIVVWGFGMAAILIILFGLYLRHASSTVLINIINAIKTGDVKQAPRLEAMLSTAIITSKETQKIYQRQATLDALTGCKNRRAFDIDIAALTDNHQAFSLALIDIDNFKSINDTWGHPEGDIVLRTIAWEGLHTMQLQDLSVYRYGGEEFAVLFPEKNSKEAAILLEQWRKNIAQRTWREEALQVTFSAGVGEWQNEPPESFISRIDNTLYKAKQQGKNRILHSA